MKKSSFVVIFAFIMAMFLPVVVCANMAAPAEPDIASAVTFEKNDEISVLSEVLSITVKGSRADIVAVYRMKNTLDKSVSTQAMFLSPNIEDSGIKVVVNDKEASFERKSYALDYNTTVETSDWQYAVLTDDEIASYSEDRAVDTIYFRMDFSANEEYDVAVSYSYRLGGYPEYDFDAKNGIIEYYLAPAAMWKDFSDLTVNLYLDEDMPVIKQSSLDFKKIKPRTYQYTSDTLPQENIRIVIDENWWQNIFSSLRSPYFVMSQRIIAPVVMIAVGIAAVIVAICVLKKKKRAKAHGEQQ